MSRVGKLNEHDREVLERTRGDYTAAIALRICEQIADGMTLTDIVKQESMPARGTIYRWFVVFPEFKEAFERAKTLSAFSYEEKALEVADLLSRPNDFSGTRIKAFEVALAQWRWTAARRDAATYGGNVQGNQAMAVQINTNLNLGQLEGTTSAVNQENIYKFTASAISEVEGDPLHEDNPFSKVIDVTPEPTDNAFDLSDNPEQDFVKPRIPYETRGRPKGSKTKSKVKQRTAAQIEAFMRRRGLGKDG